MRRIIAALLALAVLVAIARLTTQNSVMNISVTVNLPGLGEVLGNYDKTQWTNQIFMSFRGIPYAESPKGERRFKPPVARLPWKRIFDARKFGRRCPVITTVSTLSAQQLNEDLEDCLNLCVYTKNLDVKQPVMFYIYGGGFYNGSSSDHPPHHLLEKDIVLVVPQYRIGGLGWLTTLNADMPGNAPVMDLLLALQWVQHHIHAFGGDPERVTIFGQSAGAIMSGALLLSPKTPQNYFKRSIVQSGSIMSKLSLTEAPLNQVQRVCQALKCENCEDAQGQYRCLRDISVPAMLATTKSESFGPVVGDFFNVLPREPSELFKELRRPVPVMTGFTKHDGSFILATFYDIIVAAYGSENNLSVRQFANALIDKGKDNTGLANNLLLHMLFNSTLLETKNHELAWPSYFDISNIFLKSPAITLANELLRRQLAPVYLYSFDYEGSNTRFGYEMGNAHYPFNGGVHHSNDNIYVFPTHTLNAKDTQMARKMVELWTSFAIVGVPRIEGETKINPMSTEGGPYFRINEKVTIGENVLDELTVTIDDPEKDKLVRHKTAFLE